MSSDGGGGWASECRVYGMQRKGETGVMSRCRTRGSSGGGDGEVEEGTRIVSRTVQQYDQSRGVRRVVGGVVVVVSVLDAGGRRCEFNPSCRPARSAILSRSKAPL